MGCFRDYLITNETPVISWAFMPNYRANMSLKFVELIKDQAASIDELVEKLPIAEEQFKIFLLIYCLCVSG